MESSILALGAIAATLVLTTFIAWKQDVERRDLLLLGTLAAGFSAGTAALWLV